MKTAVFIEKDGILNHHRNHPHKGTPPLSLEDFVLPKDILSDLQRLKNEGFMLVATSNQPGVSDGTLNRRELDRMCRRLLSELPLDDLLICPHGEQDYCPCRKPKAGLFLEAAFKWQINLEQSFIVSEKWQDAEAARQIGSTPILIDSPWAHERRHDWIAADFSAAVDRILSSGKVITEAQTDRILVANG